MAWIFCAIGRGIDVGGVIVISEMPFFRKFR